MFVATVLALASAGLHATWNLVAKRSADPFIALWGQFFVAGVIGGVGLAVIGGVPAVGWAWAAATGAVHVPYLVALAWAYDRGDFSVAYPLARGGGALLAGIGGIVLLGDEVSGWTMAAVLIVVGGMALLAAGARTDRGAGRAVRRRHDRRLHDDRQPRRPDRRQRHVCPRGVRRGRRRGDGLRESRSDASP